MSGPVPPRELSVHTFSLSRGLFSLHRARLIPAGCSTSAPVLRVLPLHGDPSSSHGNFLSSRPGHKRMGFPTSYPGLFPHILSRTASPHPLQSCFFTVSPELLPHSLPIASSSLPCHQPRVPSPGTPVLSHLSAISCLAQPVHFVQGASLAVGV